MEKRPSPAKPKAPAAEKSPPAKAKPPAQNEETVFSDEPDEAEENPPVGAATEAAGLDTDTEDADREAPAQAGGATEAFDLDSDSAADEEAPHQAPLGAATEALDLDSDSVADVKPRAKSQVGEATEAADLDSDSAAEEEPPVKRQAGPVKKAATAAFGATQEFEQRPAQPKAAAAGKLSTLGDFKLLKKLGQGGMGAVYKAHQITLDRIVAVKVLSKELAAKPAFVHRFLREARVMAKLDHPNIVRCYEVKEAHGLHYLAMEFVDGGSIDGFLRKLGKFSIGDALHIVLRTADALQHAHELGLVHRDIKPDNILLTNKGVIKVADLGLAKGTDDNMSMTKTGTGAGTPIYMAPEQARDVKHVDGRCDIYALGVMLYVFLTGEIPFKGETLVELIEAKDKEKHEPARRLNPEVPARLDLIIDKMMARKVEHRHASCAEVMADLEGLGEANDYLSFLQEEGAPPPSKGAMTRVPGKPPAKTAAPAAAGKTATPGKAAVPAAAEAPAPAGDANLWYLMFKDKQGKQVVKKMTTPEVLGAIRNGSFNASTQVSKTIKGGYRALATYPEFEDSVHLQQTQKVAEKKGEKYRKMYGEIEQADRRRRRWKWLRGLFARGRNFVGFCIWFGIIVAVLGGIGFGAYFAWNALGEKTSDLLKDTGKTNLSGKKG